MMSYFTISEDKTMTMKTTLLPARYNLIKKRKQDSALNLLLPFTLSMLEDVYNY